MTKTFTFAIVHFGVAFTVGYALTGDIFVGGTIALVEPALNTLAFHFHERVWRHFEQSSSNVPTTLAASSTI